MSAFFPPVSAAFRDFTNRHAIGLSILSALLLCSVAADAQEADFVFRNGSVYTVTTEKPWAEAVAVSHGEIIYVGSDSEVRRHVGRRTQVIDLNHGMLLPGFIDSHTHLHGAEALLDVPLTLRGRPPQEVLASVRRYVEGHPGQKLVQGRGFIVESFLPDGPDKKMLDPIIPDRPAVFTSVDAHFMWVNSRALELAGIDTNTPDPEPGVSWFQRYPGSREPTGYVIEGAAMNMVRQALEMKGYAFESRERYLEGLKLGLPMLAAAGITTVFDAGAPEAIAYPALHELESQGQLPVRVMGSLFWRADDGDPIAHFRALQRQYHSDLVAARMIKVALDGSDNNHTAYMLDPYADDPSTHGTRLYDDAQFSDIVHRADAAKIDLHVHIVGDAAIRQALDAFAAVAAENDARDRRNTLVHVNFVHPDDIVRFRQIGVIWSSTPSWSMMTPRNVTIEHAMGGARFAQRIHRFQTPVDKGVMMNFGSDFATLQPGSVYKPLDHIEIGRTRQALGDPNFPIQPDVYERGKIADLIASYTINGAYMLRMEDKIGSIAVGKRADLVVLGQNLFDVSPYAIHSVPVMLTMMDGKVTHRAEAAAR